MLQMHFILLKQCAETRKNFPQEGCVRPLNPHDLSKRGFLKRKFGHIWLTLCMVQRLGEFEVENTSFLAAFKNSTAFINLFPSALKYNIFLQQIRHNSLHHVLRNSSETNVKVCGSS